MEDDESLSNRIADEIESLKLTVGNLCTLAIQSASGSTIRLVAAIYVVFPMIATECPTHVEVLVDEVVIAEPDATERCNFPGGYTYSEWDTAQTTRRGAVITARVTWEDGEVITRTSKVRIAR